MTETENKYQRGKIYKIVCNLTGLIYVGSTIEKTLAYRLHGHKSDYNHSLKNNLNWNKTSFQILQNDDYDIVLIELFPCNSKDELHKRERYFIESLTCVNKVIPSRTYEERKGDEKSKEINKQYYLKNKETIDEYQKQYRQDHKEETVEYKKEHYLKNKAKIDEKNTQYYEANKQRILDKMKAPFTCVCGSICRSSDRLRHEKSKKHQLFIQS